MAEVPKHIAAGLTDEQVLGMYKFMRLARLVDERMWLLNRAGKIPFVISCQGQEAAQAGAGYALDKTTDYLAPYYRDLCLALIYGSTARNELLAAFGKPEDKNSGGRQMPGHYGSRARRVISGSSPVGTQIAHGVGAALAVKMREEDAVVLVTFGEGTSNQGEFHEACNFAGVHKLPVVFLCENNKYAISVPEMKQLACRNVADRASAYGFEGIIVDGNDAVDTYAAVKQAVDKARLGQGPTLVEAKTYRLVPHSSDDDDSTYRSREEVAHWRSVDPLIRMQNYLQESGVLTGTENEALSRELKAQVDEATDYANAAPSADPSTLTRYVYGEEALEDGR